MAEFDWTPFEGDSVRFENVGDSVKGKIADITTKQGKQGPVPVLVLQTDAEGTQRELWASAADLKGQLAALRPQVGWWISVEFSGERHTGQASPMKLFTIKVKEPAADAPAPVVQSPEDEFLDGTEPF